MFNANITRTIGKCGLIMQRHLPTILTVASAVGTGAAVVFAIKETRKVDTILEEYKENMATLNEVYENPDKYIKDGEEYTEEDYKKDLAITYAKTGAKLVKLYWPSIVCVLGSIACGFTANGMLRGRNLALAASYGAISGSYNQYRQRIANKFGEEVEKQIFRGEEENEEAEVTTDKNGKKKTITHKKKSYNPSGYSRVFDESNINWMRWHSNNLNFLKNEQRYANDRLRARGFLTLAEIYERLGFDVTPESLCVGWIWTGHDIPNTEGDNYVDFGIDSALPHNFDDELDDHGACVFLDFNVDGPILDRIPRNNRIWVRN